MLELLHFDFSPFPTIYQWIQRMRELPYIQKANEKFEAKKAYFESLKKTSPQAWSHAYC